MRRRLHLLKEYLKYKKHQSFVESRVVELRRKITKESIETGCADELTRTLFIKYNNYLKSLLKKI
tara:strand:- start:214 stop:408 length:195 start_codon:yes stop_codon:yes gene_type:complete